MARLFTGYIDENDCIGDSLGTAGVVGEPKGTINQNSLALDVAVQSLSAYDNSLRAAITPSSSNLTITNNLTATSDIVARNNIRIFKTSTNSWISLGDKQLTHESWMFNDLGGHIMPLNRTKLDFFYTGAIQTWVVPVGVTFVYAKLWGAGGAGGTIGGWAHGSHGGGGGHTRGLIPVTPGETLTILVGQGGIVNQGASPTFGFGGGCQINSDNRYGGGGGGGTFVFRNYVPTTPQPGGTPLLVAGGGGGGGSSRIFHATGSTAWGYNDGGAGGGRVGQKGNSLFDSVFLAGGNPGTQSSVGLGGSGSGVATGRRGGGQYVAGAYTDAAIVNQYQGGTAFSNFVGGAGGGGYFGGGGGGYRESNTIAGGGGGSGFAHSSVIFGETFTGIGRGCPYATDPDLTDAQNTAMQFGTMFGLGYGGMYQSQGFNGYLALYY